MVVNVERRAGAVRQINWKLYRTIFGQVTCFVESEREDSDK